MRKKSNLVHLDDYRRVRKAAPTPSTDILYANAKKEFNRHIRPSLTRLLEINGFSSTEVKNVADSICECYITNRLERIKGVI